MNFETRVSRPGICSTGESLPIKANFFKFQLGSNTLQIVKYDVSFPPELPPQQSRLRERIFRRIRQPVTNAIGKFVFANTMLFSIRESSNTSEEVLTFETEHDNQLVSISLTPVGEVTSDKEELSFFNKFFNQVQGRLNLVMIGRKFFNPEREIQIPRYNLSVWPGYANAVVSVAAGTMLNVDISHRCLRTISVLDQLKEIQKKSRDHRLDFSRLIIGSVVITMYNKKTYHIDDVDWDANPCSTFQQGDQQVQYMQYYSTRWQQTITTPQQPLLISKSRDRTFYLIPQLCYITGLTDQIRSDFNIMKEMANATKKEPVQRLNQSAGLIQALQTNPKTFEEIRQWKANISNRAIQLTGHVLQIGSLVLGQKQERIGNNGSFDRECQNKMLEAPNLGRWIVFSTAEDQQLAQSFISVFNQASNQFKLQCNAPIQQTVRSDRWNDWEALLKNSLNPQIQMIVCILPGNRGKSRLYDDLKRLLLSDFPVPSQVILNATLKKPKGLRSVVNKVLIQMNAKAGGIPWSISGLPYTDQPTMVVGIDIYHKAGAHSVLGFVATVDRNFAKYVPIPKINAPTQQVSSQLIECMREAINQFGQSNNIAPKRVIVYRDGVSDSQRETVKRNELPQLLQAFNQLNQPQPQIAYVVVNKRINARFYSNRGGKIDNPPIGTCIDTEVVSKDEYDFYLMPARATQGAMTPTHFFVVQDTTRSSCDELESLTYKLCYTYYNWSGSIRVPAPCQYAHKLAYMIGERATKQGPPTPHAHWFSTRSMYYL